jgi:uncharacterized protein (TIGR02246 family)
MSSDVTAAISAANQVFMEAFARGDAAGVARLYTGDGQLLPPGGDAQAGSVAIERFWSGVMTMGIKAAELSTVEIEDHGNTAIEIGQYALAGDEGQTLDRGKYVVVWKRDGGAWKLHRDIWNTSQQSG